MDPTKWKPQGAFTYGLPIVPRDLSGNSTERVVLIQSIMRRIKNDHKHTQDELTHNFTIAQNLLRNRCLQLRSQVQGTDIEHEELRRFYDQFLSVITNRQAEVLRLFAEASTDTRDSILAQIQSTGDQMLDTQVALFAETMNIQQIRTIENQHAQMQERLCEIFRANQDSLKKTRLQLLDELKGGTLQDKVELLGFYDELMRMFTDHKCKAIQQTVARTLEAQKNAILQIQSLVDLVLKTESRFFEQMSAAQKIMQEMNGKYSLVQLPGL